MEWVCLKYASHSSPLGSKGLDVPVVDNTRLSALPVVDGTCTIEVGTCFGSSPLVVALYTIQ